MPSQLSAYQQLFKKFPAASGDPYCGDIDFGLYDTARTACLRSYVPEQIYRPYSSLPSLFKAKKSPQRQALRGVFLFLSVRYQPVRF